MSHPQELKRLNREITSHLGHLSKCCIYVLSLYVLGMVIMRHCGQTQIATFLSGLMDCHFGSMKHEVDVKSCFAPLLGWVLAKFKGDQRQVVLALDATYLTDRFVILAISVVVAGCAIPVAWHIQKIDAKGEERLREFTYEAEAKCGKKRHEVDVKRGVFHWEQTKMTCPQRAERLWLVISIALLWLTSLGQAAAQQPHWQSLRQARPQAPLLSAPALGWIDLILSILKGVPLSFGYLNPYPWSHLPDP